MAIVRPCGNGPCGGTVFVVAVSATAWSSNALFTYAVVNRQAHVPAKATSIKGARSRRSRAAWPSRCCTRSRSGSSASSAGSASRGRVLESLEAARIPHVEDVVPAYLALTVFYDSLNASYAEMAAQHAAACGG